MLKFYEKFLPLYYYIAADACLQLKYSWSLSLLNTKSKNSFHLLMKLQTLLICITIFR